MRFVHNVTNYDGQVISSWDDRDQAERNADEDDVVVSEVLGPWKPRQCYREVVRCYYDGKAVDPISETRTVHRHEAWDVEMAVPTVDHGLFAEDGRMYAEITVDAWDRFDAMEVTIEVARHLHPQPDVEGPVQGPPSPADWCKLLSEEGWAKGWVHTGAAVDVYNTGRRWVQGDYEAGDRWSGLPLIISGNPESGFFDQDRGGQPASVVDIRGRDHTAEAMKLKLAEAKAQGDRGDIIQFVVLVVLLCACGYLAVQIIAWLI